MASLDGRRRAVVALLLLAVAGGLLRLALRAEPVALPDAPPGRIACVSYTPFYRPGESPLDPHVRVSAARIEADLAVLSRRFGCVRTYSVGQGMDQVPAIAQRDGMQVLLGIWLGRDPAANAREMTLGIATARAHRTAIRAIVVGNEVLLRGELPASAIATDLDQVRAATGLPVTYADVWEFWLQHPQLAAHVDFVTIHILPYWEDRPVAVGRAVQHVAAVVSQVRAAFPGKPMLIGETGWPSRGRAHQAAVPSLVNEARFVREFLLYAQQNHVPYNLIEAFDQPWKRRLEGTVGGYWGLYDDARQPKFPLHGPVTEDPQAWHALAPAALLALAFALPAWRRRRPHAWALRILAGFGSGLALAAAWQQLADGARSALEWVVGSAALAAMVVTVWILTARLARWIGDDDAAPAVPVATLMLTRMHCGWLIALAWLDLLLVFDPRYRDLPLALVAPAALGFALLRIAGLAPATARADRRPQLLALGIVLLATVIVLQERGLNPWTWAWLGLNLLLGSSLGRIRPV
ncbi:MAG TPA: glycoside hydrolase family 17 [Rhodanobacteraceae bacterium]|nr:glycoside hydrolase family 17 [Rhodanobacteraceae bacterium]